MHATDLVALNDITRVLLVYSCQQGVYPRGHVLPLRLTIVHIDHKIFMHSVKFSEKMAIISLSL
jgi:hypothetical protein